MTWGTAAVRGSLCLRYSSSLLAGLLSLASSSAAVANQMEAGQAAWAEGDFEQAIVLLSPLAQRGDRDAQYLVGQMLTCGYGAPIDLVRGFSWYSAAAEQGHPDAQYAVAQEWAMARRSNTADPIPEDHAQSYFWFALAVTSYEAAGKSEQLRGALEMRNLMAHRIAPEEKARVDAAIEAWQPTDRRFAER